MRVGNNSIFNLLFKFFCHVFQQPTDMQMLRTYIFTLTAFYAVTGLAAVFCMNLVIIIPGVPVVKDLFCVQAGKQIGNGNALRANLGAISAGSTRDGAEASENAAYFFHSGVFLRIQGLKILHVTDVVLHHFHIAHTGQNHHYALLAGSKADSVAGIGAAVQCIEYFLRFGRQLHKAAALDRLHNDSRFTMLAADFEALAGFHRRIIEVHIIQLNLHNFHLRIFRKDLIQHGRLIVEGDT